LSRKLIKLYKWFSGTSLPVYWDYPNNGLIIWEGICTRIDGCRIIDNVLEGVWLWRIIGAIWESIYL